MAVDMIARMMAMGNGGGSGDSYTKAQTDALLDGKADLTDGKVPASELPSYVDDTVEGYYYQGAFYKDSEHTITITGETGKIYIDLTTNKSYRWTGTVYVRIDECPAFGETQGTIYEGNKGKQNADAIASIKDGANIDSFADVETALAAKLNKSDVDSTLSSTSTNPVQNKVLTGQIGGLVDRGAKNLAKFDIWAKQCSLVRGTKTIGSDGAITITATSSDCYTLFSPTDFPVECRIPVTPDHEMVATWTASETGSGNKYLYIFPNGGTTGSIAVKASDGIKRFTVPDGCTYITWRIGCSASGDTITFNNLMICSAADYDASSAYEPYALPNTTITPAFIKQVNEGAKNKFDIFNAAEEKSETVTRTINADGTVTVSNSGSNPSPSVLYYQTYLTAGVPYVISGCPSGGSDSSYLLSVRTFDGATIKNSTDTGSGSNAFTVSTSGMYVLYLRIAARYAFSNIVFKPMICTAEDWEASHKFVPYAPTNRELYEMILALQNAQNGG